MSEKLLEALELTMKLQRANIEAKKWHRDEYPEKIKVYTDILQKVKDTEKVDSIQALIKVLKKLDDGENPMMAMMFCAAAVDMI